MKLPDDGMVAVTATNTIAAAAAASCVLLFQCNFRPKAQRGCWQSVEIGLFSLETHTHILGTTMHNFCDFDQIHV